MSASGPAPLCAAYEVACLPGTRPARGRLALAQGELRSTDFCRADGRHDDWLPRHVKDGFEPSACFSCPTRSLLPRRGEGVEPLSQCTIGWRYNLLQCLPPNLLPPPDQTKGGALPDDAGAADVLLASSDNRGHGLFAMVERVINQILFARANSLVPYVYIGEYVFAEGRACEHGRVAYYDPTSGPNVWEYYFVQPAAYRPGDTHVPMRSSSGRRVRSVQVVAPEALYHTAGHTQTYVGGGSYDGRARLALRTAAHSVFGNGSLVRQTIRSRVDGIFAPWRVASSHILGVHMRGTDKVVTKKVPPEAYWPFVDAYVAAHPDALVFVASDEREYHERVVNRYGLWAPRQRRSRRAGGRVVRAGSGYEGSANVIREARARGGGHAKGVEVLLDALLLSKCDFLLKSASAVPEFAIWVNLDLHHNHIDLQYEDRLRSQHLPSWAADVGREEATAYCSALARGCRSLRQRSGQQCARCEPRVDESSEAAARRARPMALVTASSTALRCENASGGGRQALRGLRLVECVAYARYRRLEFIGVGEERREFAGCVLWNGRTVEFNRPRGFNGARAGCNVGAKGGECLCTTRGASRA